MTAESIQLRPDVQLLHRDGGVTLLHAPAIGRTLRVSRGGERLLPALAAGTTVDALLAQLGSAGPSATAALSGFLDRLRTAGMLAGSEPAPAAPMPVRLKPLVNINPLARAIAWPLRALPPLARRALVALAIAGAAIGLANLAITNGRPELTGVLWEFNAWAIVWLFLIHIPLHELGHAVAAHLAGCRVDSAGVMFARFGMPIAYVHTPDAMRIRERLPRVWISAGGPLVDLLAAGVGAWVAALLPGPIGDAATYFVFLVLLTFLINLNPWFATDGSHMLQAALNDERVRGVVRGKAARGMTSTRAVRVYRIAGIAYVIVVLVALLGVWRWP